MSFISSRIFVTVAASLIAVVLAYFWINYTEVGATFAAKYDDVRKIYALVGVAFAIVGYFSHYLIDPPTGLSQESRGLLDGDLDAAAAGTYEAQQAQEAAEADLGTPEAFEDQGGEGYGEQVLDEPFE